MESAQEEMIVSYFTFQKAGNWQNVNNDNNPRLKYQICPVWLCLPVFFLAGDYFDSQSWGKQQL